MQEYISGIRDELGSDYSVVSFHPDNLGSDYIPYKLAFNGSDTYKRYTKNALKSVLENGVKGVMCISGHRLYFDEYILYTVNKANIALMSCLEFEGSHKNIPFELYNQVYCPTSPIRWSIPIYIGGTNDKCLFRFADLYIGNNQIMSNHISDVIFQYYNTVAKLGSMLDYNIDMLSGCMFYPSEWKKSSLVYIEGTFYYNNFNQFRGSLNEFGHMNYIDCDISPRHIYRLHKGDVFQYIGCPLFIDEYNTLYLGYCNSSSSEELSGVMRYRITDRKKFDTIISKFILLNGSKIIDMYDKVDDIKPSSVRLGKCM